MRSVIVLGPAAIGVSTPVVLDQYLNPQEAGLAVQFPAGAAATCKVQYSLDDPFATYATDYNTNAVWYDHATITAKTANFSANLGVIARAVRLNNTAWTSGQPTLTVVQTGAAGG